MQKSSPPHEEYDYPINMQLGAKILVQCFYVMLELKLSTFCEYLQKKTWPRYSYEDPHHLLEPLSSLSRRMSSMSLCRLLGSNQVTICNQSPLLHSKAA